MKNLFYKVVKLDFVDVDISVLSAIFFYNGKSYMKNFKNATIQFRNVYLDEDSVIHVGKDTIVQQIDYDGANSEDDIEFRKRFDLNKLMIEALDGVSLDGNVISNGITDSSGENIVNRSNTCDVFKFKDHFDVFWSEVHLKANEFRVNKPAYSVVGLGTKILIKITSGELFDRKDVIDVTADDLQMEFDF